MAIVERVKALGLPLDQLVVIGSGLLDAYGLRQAADLDLSVSPELFESLKKSGDFTLNERSGLPFLYKDDVEVWLGWNADIVFEDLKTDAVYVDGVAFANPAVIIKRKTERGLEKDLRDIKLLEEYLYGNK